VIVVEHPDGTVTLYAHTVRNISAAGDLVDTSTIIALTGSTGRSTGPHLHFEAWNNGENITHSYLPGGTPGTPHRTMAEIPIKRYLQADGTLVFTNLP
jgi:murein DD-endopeptidase MepM/ murein hydrolase activator NlpD